MVRNTSALLFEELRLLQLNDSAFIAHPAPLCESLHRLGQLYFDLRTGLWICTRKGAELQATEEITISISGEGVTTIRFDPAYVTHSLDGGRGVLTLVTKSHGAEKSARSMLYPLEAPSHERQRREEESLRETVQQELFEIFAAVLDVPIGQVHAKSDFFEAGGDVELAALLSALTHRFHVELDPEVVYDHPALADLAEHVAESMRCAKRTPQEREVVHS